MRLAVIADIHGNHLALEAVLEDIAAQKVDITVNLGDCFSGPLDARKAADLLLPLDLPTVRGNHDRYLVDMAPDTMGPSDRVAHSQLNTKEFDWLRGLPQTLVIEDTFFLCHATPKADDSYWLIDVEPGGRLVERDLVDVEALADNIRCPLLLCGHTHLPALKRLSDGRMIVNPGSVGCPAYDDDLPHFHKVEAGHSLASYAVVEERTAGYSVKFHNVPYDHAAMARLAEQNGRAEWAAGLATGYL